MKASFSKTGYMCVNEREARGMVGIRSKDGKVHELNYLGSTVQRNGACG